MSLLREIAGFKDYKVDRYGNIYSFKCMCRVLKQGTNGCKYKKVWLYNEGVRTAMYVHRIVAVAFIGDIPDGMEVDHIDGNRCNNNVQNLQYISHLENVRKAKIGGEYCFEKKYASKTT